MAEKTQSAQVFQVAFSATLCDGQDMIGIPQALTVQALEPPFDEKPQPVGPPGTLQLGISSARVDAAEGANAPVPLQYLLAKVSRIGAQPPLMYAPIRTERKAPRGDFEVAPTAQSPAVGAFRQSGAIGETAAHGARST